MTNETLTALIGAAGVILGGMVTALVTYWVAARQSDAEAHQHQEENEDRDEEIRLKWQQVQEDISQRVWERAQMQLAQMADQIKTLEKLVADQQEQLKEADKAAVRLRQDYENEREMFNADLERIKAALRRERQRSQTFRDGVYILINQLRGAGIAPNWNPPPNGHDGEED